LKGCLPPFSFFISGSLLRSSSPKGNGTAASFSFVFPFPKVKNAGVLQTKEKNERRREQFVYKILVTPLCKEIKNRTFWQNVT